MQGVGILMDLDIQELLMTVKKNRTTLRILRIFTRSTGLLTGAPVEEPESKFEITNRMIELLALVSSSLLKLGQESG